MNRLRKESFLLQQAEFAATDEEDCLCWNGTDTAGRLLSLIAASGHLEFCCKLFWRAMLEDINTESMHLLFYFIQMIAGRVEEMK
jgi:hypothetical protein